ncbi:MAG TPA: two-component regulator propeller domain-containing protein [Parafilimonas sp.]|nr:two-component regulator propeller domain-containing protein [Parafilimonas sp.]
MLFRYFFIPVLLRLSCSCFAQNDFKFESFTTESGLSENMVYAVYQDSKGYLWIGTHDGLNRYDGYNFKKFRHEPVDKNSLPDNTVMDICEDGQNNLWLAGHDGFCRFNVAENTFTNFIPDTYYAPFSQVISLDKFEMMLKHGEILYRVKNDISIKERLTCTDSTKKIFVGDIGYKGTFSSLYKSKEGNIFIAKNINSLVYIWQYDRSTRGFVLFKKIQVDKKISDAKIDACVISGNECWLAFEDVGIIRTDIAAGNISYSYYFDSTEAGIIKLFIDDENNVWTGTDKTLLFYDRRPGSTKVIRHNEFPGSVNSDLIQTIYQDRTGIIWIGTSNGINKLNPLQRKFKHLTAKGDDAVLLEDFVLGIYPQPNNCLRIFYNDGAGERHFSDLDASFNLIKHYAINKYDTDKWLKESVIKYSGKISDNLFRNIKFLLSKNDLTNRKKNDDIPVLVVNDTGLYITSGWRMQNLTEQSYVYNGSLIIYSEILGDEIWFATSGDGLTCYDTHLRKLTRYNVSSLNAGNINSNDVTCFLIETNGNMWVATKSGGLNYFNRQNKKFIHYTQVDGLCNNSIYCMVKDNNNCLWLGTSNGLSCFNLSTKKFKNYKRSEGLINDEYNRNSACRLANGTIVMGGTNGIDYFHPDSLINKKIKPQVQITGLTINNKPLFEKTNLSLKHDENYVTIQFAGLDFTNPSSNQFIYKLEGADKGWINSGSVHFASYSNLRPGKYHFEVKAMNSDGTWSDIPAEYNFTITPAWYQTWWFQAGILIITITGIYFFIRYYIKTKLQQQKMLLEKQQAIQSERLRISSELHDDLGSGLSTIRLISEMMKDASGDNTISSQLHKISDSSKELVQKMNEIVWALNINNDNLQSLLAYIRQYAVKTLDDMGISCNVAISESVPVLTIAGIERRMIFLMVKECIHNIIKHSKATQVMIEITLQENISIKIADDGIGFAPGENGVHHFGIINLKQRAKQLNGSIEWLQNNGTTVYIQIPLSSISHKSVTS